MILLNKAFCWLTSADANVQLLTNLWKKSCIFSVTVLVMITLFAKKTHNTNPHPPKKANNTTKKTEKYRNKNRNIVSPYTCLV